MKRVSVSTWALHGALGLTYWDRPGSPTKQRAETYGPGTVALLDVPARLAEMGIHTMELCHFQIPTRDVAYLEDLRAALDAADVQLFSLLIDDGDITHPEHGARDLDWIAGWIDTAGGLGAERARVIAGRQEPTAETLERSRAGLARLAARAGNVRVTTENWFGLLPRPEPVHALLDSLNGTVGLCLDFGNWDDRRLRTGSQTTVVPTKYEDLAAIAPRAESCHAKARFTGPNAIDREDYTRCLDLTRAVGFDGPYTLVDGGPGDEWEGLALQRDLLQPHLG